MSTDRRITMEDIATAMNISKSTVSIAIADKYGVSEEMRSKIVLKAIEMGYDFSQVKIKPGKKKKIALIVEDNSKFLASAFWMSIIRGIEQRTRDMKYQFKLMALSQYESFDDIYVEVSNSKLSGVILLAGERNMKELALGLEKLKIGVVLVDSVYELSNRFDEVRASNYVGGVECAEYLLSKGHTKFVFLGYHDLAYSMRERRSGFYDGLMCKGEYEVSTVLCDPILANEEEPIKQMLEQNTPPYAVFCANDYLANSLYYYAEKNGFKIPEDISVVGFDNVELLDDISLTTFNVPKEIMGSRAVDLLIDKINNFDKPVEIVNIAVSLIERNSVYNLSAYNKKEYL